MNITEQLLSLDNKALFGKIQEIFAHAEETQKVLLTQILAANTQCVYGRKYHFDQIKDIETYRKQVPICCWKDLDSDLERVVAGEKDVLFSGDVKQFLLTTGSTGKAKHIPESYMSGVARRLVLRLRQIYDAMAVPRLLELLQRGKTDGVPGRLLTLANVQGNQNKTPSGIPVSYASELTMKQSGLNNYLAFPTAVYEVKESLVKDYLIMRFAIEHPDILIISGNNAARLAYLIHLAETHKEEILLDIEKGTIDHAGAVDEAVREKLASSLHPNPTRAAQLRQLLSEGKPFTPVSYWPDLSLALFWLSSSVGYFVKDVRPLLPATTKMMDVGYGASEAKFNIPIKPEDPSGLLSIASTFFEFLPVKGGSPLLAHELEVGEQYELVITTWGGLYRYNMEDIVICRGFVGTTPKIEFVTKSTEVLNICDEKVFPNNIVPCAIEALANQGAVLCQMQIYADSQERVYRCFVEVEGDPENVDLPRFTKEFHTLLCRRSIGYSIFTDSKVLRPLQVTLMKTGWQKSLIQAKLKEGRSLTQIKLPLIIKELANNEWYFRKMDI